MQTLWVFQAPSQELESERPPDPRSRPSAVGPRGFFGRFGRLLRHALRAVR
jgi:hypothetical protein